MALTQAREHHSLPGLPSPKLIWSLRKLKRTAVYVGTLLGFHVSLGDYDQTMIPSALSIPEQPRSFPVDALLRG